MNAACPLFLLLGVAVAPLCGWDREGEGVRERVHAMLAGLL